MLLGPFLLCVYALGVCLTMLLVFDESRMPGGGIIAVGFIALVWPLLIVMAVVGGLFIAIDRLSEWLSS